MNIKRFAARDMRAALDQVRAELGADAIILSTRRRRAKDPETAAMGATVEVVAAVDLDLDSLPNGNGKSGPQYENTGGSADDPAEAAQQRFKTAEDITGLAREIAEVKTLLRRLLARGGERAGCIQGGEGLPENRRAPLLMLHRAFSELGLEPRLQRALASRLLSRAERSEEISVPAVHAWIREYARRRIRTGPVTSTHGPPYRWALIGPTGVGKTTTLAKLAALFKFQKGMHGVLVTVDTYKLGGMEQIQKYGELMDLQVESAGEPGQLQAIFARHRDKDFILVDTTGRSTRDPRHGAELSEIFRSVPDIQGQALLCATAKVEDLTESVRCYFRFPLAGWIITKIDETRFYGPLCTQVLGRELPITYITNGQRVPEDIEPATPQKLARILLNPPEKASSPDGAPQDQGAGRRELPKASRSLPGVSRTREQV